MRRLAPVVSVWILLSVAWAQPARDAAGGAVVDARRGTTTMPIAAGEMHSLVVDASGRVWAWGSNQDGQLGNRGVGHRAVPVLASFATETTVVGVGAGRRHSVALDDQGRAWAWGANDEGQLGDGSVTARAEPVPVVMPPGVVFRTVSAGWNHSLALDADGRAWAWGRNSEGQLGDGSRTNRLAPVPVRMPDGVVFTLVVAGSSHALALDQDGRAWAWGQNGASQLGDGGRSDRTSPVPVRMPQDVTFVSVAGGLVHSLAIDRNGRVWGWGSDLAGQIGDGRGPPERATPERVGLPEGVRFAHVAGGVFHSAALDTEGRAWSWGADFSGRLGAGGGLARDGPGLVSMPSGTAFSTLAVGSDHTLALDLSGAVWGWGENRAGHLGDASTVNRSAPVRAHLPHGVTAADVGPPSAPAQDATVWDERYVVDWGRFGPLPAPGVPRAVGFEGITSETGVSLTYAPVGGTGSWMIDVIVSGEHPPSPSIADDVALVSVFPLGVVTLAVPEPVWVDDDGVVLEVFDARTASWIAVHDSYRRPGAEAMLWDWIDGAFLMVDVLSLAVPKLQLLKILLMLPRVLEEYKEAEWEAALDPANLVPSEGAFFDPNSYRVVQIPWRFDGLERYLAETAGGGFASSDEAGPWSRLPYEGGVVPVRVRVPLAGASEEALAAVRAFVVVTEEHSIYAPTPMRPPLTGTTAAPIPLPSRVIARAPERTSISRYALRIVEERGLRRVPILGDATVGVRVPPWPDGGERPADAVEFGHVAVGSVSGATYESTAGFAVETVGSGAATFVLTLDARAGPRFSSVATGYTVSFDEGVAYLAVPNAPGLRVGYDDVSIQAFNYVSGTWDVVPNAYAGPSRPSASTAGSRAVAVTWEVMLGEALSAMGGHGIARSLVAINIAKELGALNQVAPDTRLVEAPAVVPADPAFYDPNRYRLVEFPWTLSRLMPRGDSGDPGVFLYADPRDPARGGMRLRIVVPVEGLPRERIAGVRAFASSVERLVAWTTPVIGPPRQQMFRTRVVTAPSMAVDARSNAGSGAATQCLALAAWGRNSHGQTDVPAHVAVRTVRAGLFHGLAIAADGSLLAWGRNDHGQGAVPVDLPPTEYVAVGTGTDDSFAVARDGSLYMWGGSFSGVVVQEAFGVVDVRVEDAHHALLGQDGRVRVRGWTLAEEGVLEPAQGDYVQIDTSRSELLLLTHRGLFSLGHLTVPPAIRDADDIAAISVGEFGAAVAHVDGAVTWWALEGSADVVRQQHGAAAVDVAVGRDFVAVLFDDGSVRVSGPDRNSVGLIPPLPGVIRDLEAGFDYVVALVEREDCR